MTVNDEYLTVSKLYVKDGDRVKKGDVLAELETSKTVISIEAECDGIVNFFCKEGDDVKVNSVIIKIVDNEDQKDNEEYDNGTVASEYNKGETIFSDKALALLDKNNIDKSEFDEYDFVSVDDVYQFIKSKTSDDSADFNENREITKETDTFIQNDEDDIVCENITKTKKTEIENLRQVQSGLMNSVIYVSVDADGLSNLLKNTFKIFKDSFLPLIVYESSRLLLKYKHLNAYFMGNKIAYYKNINIGVAIDIDDGLKVITLPNTDKLSMLTIEEMLYNLVEKYLEKKLEVSDVTGSTFTITDLSTSGVDLFVPLINSKQSAILGISQVDKKLNRFYLTLVFDHRVTEGKIAAKFLVELKDRIESYNLSQDENKIFEVKDKKLNNKEFRCSVCLKTLEEDKKMQGSGLIKVINHQGKETYLCYTCFMGY